MKDSLRSSSVDLPISSKKLNSVLRYAVVVEGQKEHQCHFSKVMGPVGAV